MDIRKLVASIVLCEFAGLIGSVFTFPAITTWYATVQKPGFIPPNWLFAPVWTILFLLMGISLYHVWTAKMSDKKSRHNQILGFYLFGLQLTLNVAWSLLFFGLHNLLAAFAEIILLWLAILATIIVFNTVSRRAAFLLIPYILWVSFAAILTYSVWILNV